jgi:hypothetical protein
VCVFFKEEGILQYYGTANTWKILKCGAGGGWKRSVGLIM